ncbi:MAG: YmfQ family protein [Eubacteriales bacterium]|nr:YmfQ family protein [Eubacteriales bacterium]
MAHNVDMIGYLPPIMQEYKELVRLIQAEEPEFQTLSDECGRLLDNLFIDSADADGIARFEKIVGVLPFADDTLALRRTRLFARWNDVTPYTLKTLRNKIVSIQGNENIEVEVSTTEYEITITTRLEQRGQVDDLAYLLKAIMPCNLRIISQNKLEGLTAGQMRYGGGITETNTLFLTNDLTGECAANVPEYLAAGMEQTEMLFLTNDIAETVNINGNMLVANGICGTAMIG